MYQLQGISTRVLFSSFKKFLDGFIQLLAFNSIGPDWLVANMQIGCRPLFDLGTLGRQ